VESTGLCLSVLFQFLLFGSQAGVDKGNNTNCFKKYTSESRQLICLGKDNAKLKQHFATLSRNQREQESIEEAVNWGKSLGESGDAGILLSPAAPVLTFSKNYEDRGNHSEL